MMQWTDFSEWFIKARKGVRKLYEVISIW